MNTFNFNGFICNIVKTEYASGGTALILNDAASGERVAVATVNIPECDIQPNHVLIKDWSENEGILQTLVNANIVKEMGITVPCGFAEAHLCEFMEGAI